MELLNVWRAYLLWMLLFDGTYVLSSTTHNVSQGAVGGVQACMTAASDSTLLVPENNTQPNALPKKESSQNIVVLIVVGVIGSVATYMALQKLTSNSVENRLHKVEESLREAEAMHNTTSSDVSSKEGTIEKFNQQIDFFTKSNENLKSDCRTKKKEIKELVNEVEQHVKKAYSEHCQTYSNVNIYTGSMDRTNDVIDEWDNVFPKKDLEKTKKRISLIQGLISSGAKV